MVSLIKVSDCGQCVIADPLPRIKINCSGFVLTQYVSCAARAFSPTMVERWRFWGPKLFGEGTRGGRILAIGHYRLNDLMPCGTTLLK